jgi:hypothetical protein
MIWLPRTRRGPHRCGTDTGFGRFPARLFAINQAWLELALTGIDLLPWTQMLLLDGDLAAAEHKKLRYRLLHAPPASPAPPAKRDDAPPKRRPRYGPTTPG